eukprot:TRINITY_DN12933_c0_g1_i1.p1 TRINITY_DN12933_c0_g1~~TRINITY_DN12933_c0_g1_i1.p1  ORF type:complete len:100 (-),score=9.74 TRINITY_DN12933_c0_g1_i1:48-347(-)
MKSVFLLLALFVAISLISEATPQRQFNKNPKPNFPGFPGVCSASPLSIACLPGPNLCNEKDGYFPVIPRNIGRCCCKCCNDKKVLWIEPAEGRKKWKWI